MNVGLKFFTPSKKAFLRQPPGQQQLQYLQCFKTKKKTYFSFSFQKFKESWARAEGRELETTSLLRLQIEGECIAVKAKLLQLLQFKLLQFVIFL